MKTEYTFKGSEVYYCYLCERFILICRACGSGTCSGGGCKECTEWSTDWINNYKVYTAGFTIPIQPVAFISGHLDLTQEEYNNHYSERVLTAILENHAFVVGDARGADTLAQQQLNAWRGTAVRLYHMFDSPRNNAFIGTERTSQVVLVGGFKNDLERDEAMTNTSMYDIAWVRPGREKSGTQKNLDRREKQLKDLEKSP